MASSSVSQESLDRDDYDFVGSRRGGSGGGRVRAVRGRGWSGPRNDSMESGDMEGHDFMPPSGLADVGELGEHDSPTRTPSRLKDKRGRPIHLHKGKTAKDKRKLREKRRSTGVVHLASNESTGDSLDEDEKLVEARRNTSYNEIIDADNPQTPEEDRKGYGTRTRNKSPSDLEADLEDNQDYDSTVSQSETNLTMIGRMAQSHASPAPSQAQSKFRMRNPITENITLHKSSLSSITTTPGGTDPESCKEEDEAIEINTGPKQRISGGGGTLSGSTLTSVAPLTAPTAAGVMTLSASSTSNSSPPPPPSALNSLEPQQRPVSYPSRFVDRDLDMESYMASVAAREPGAGGGVGAPLKSSLSNRMGHNKENNGMGTGVGQGDGSGAGGAAAAAMAGRGTREHVRWRDRTGSNDAAVAERLAHLEQALAEEKQQSQRLRESLFERDALVSDLRREIALLHKDLEVADEEYNGVKQENQALLRALASLAVDC